MIELVILVLFIVLITGVILVYKKYVKVVNVINDEQNRKYKEISELIGSNNENIKDNEKATRDILNRDNVDVNELENIINDNNKRVKTNKNNLNKYNFEDLNKIFSYDNGFIIGNSSSQINIGDNNIRLNVENPSKIRVCNEQNECTGSNSFATLQGVLKDYPLLENDLSSSHIDSKDDNSVPTDISNDNQGEDVNSVPTVPESSTKTYQIKITDPDGFNYISVAQNGNFEDKITIANEVIVNGALKEKKYQSAGNYTYIEFNNKVTGIVGTIENVDPSLTLSFLNDNDKSGGVELISID
jgi:hypothetical protein